MKIMSVDLGDARTGLAVCDVTETLASPLGVIHEKNSKKLLLRVTEASVECGAEEIIVGLPKNMDGSEGGRAAQCRMFAEKLSGQVKAPVTLWDERSTTVLAHSLLNATDTRGQKRKAVIDEVAAVIILESYLTYRKNRNL